MEAFTGNVALVTGAASGIGRAIAQRYAQSDARVVVSDVEEEGGRETIRLIQESGGEATFISAPEACKALIRKTIEAYGQLDVAWNNAGIGGEQNATADYSLEGWQQVIGINLSGVFYCMKYEIPAMLEAGGGVIVKMASTWGRWGSRPHRPT